MLRSTIDYISIGGNRHSASADWSTQSGIVAFGADHNVALWRPLDRDTRGIFALLGGHTAKVNAVTFLQPTTDIQDEVIVSGSADGEIRVFKGVYQDTLWSTVFTAKAHDGAVNCIATLKRSRVLLSGGADATIKIWKWNDDKSLTLLSTIATNPKFIPLCLVVGRFDGQISSDSAFLAAGGTKNDISIYSLQDLFSVPKIILAAGLKGHEGWIRSLALCTWPTGDQLLASASADKYVRLWKFSKGDNRPQPRQGDPAAAIVYENTLTAKVQKVSVTGAEYSITFEALLLSHEDWVYSAAWSPDADNPQLLTASADGSLAIWEPDPTSGIWVSASRLGEISGQKGATTATGSSGGFWNALWSPDRRAVTCLGRTGSWRLWQFDEAAQYWVQKPAISGHVSSVNGIAWAPDGSYLLSTGSDQTTRLHAEWRRRTKRTWHEFARPQIHGYDLNCISCTSPSQFTSGADEKLLRVFDEPKPIAKMLQRLCRIKTAPEAALPETAAIPVLGLSNKALDEPNGVHGGEDDVEGEAVPIAGLESSVDDIDEPPTEDLLARHTLWPEREKLYGHGYEISEAAVSEQNHHLLATTCKASSLDHAVIRLYDTTTWNEIKPALTAHNLTVTRLSWSSSPDQYLLSVGRDRQWALFTPSGDGGAWKLIQSNPKAHTRMILDAAWSPVGGRPFFATAGRDKVVKIWAKDPPSLETGFSLAHTINRKSAVTAVALTCNIEETYAYLAVGEEDGNISILELDMDHHLAITKTHELANHDLGVPLSRAVNRLAWRPCAIRYADDGAELQLAVAGADSSVRIMRVQVGQA